MRLAKNPKHVVIIDGWNVALILKEYMGIERDQLLPELNKYIELVKRANPKLTLCLIYDSRCPDPRTYSIGGRYIVHRCQNDKTADEQIVEMVDWLKKKFRSNVYPTIVTQDRELRLRLEIRHIKTVGSGVFTRAITSGTISNDFVADIQSRERRSSRSRDLDDMIRFG